MSEPTPLDAPLLDRTDPTLARPLPGPLVRARAEILAAAAGLLAIPDTALDRPWSWRDGSEVEVRYAAYRAFEALELAEDAARRILAPAEAREVLAARTIAPATAARWDLHGLLLPLPDSVLDEDPGGGEWPIRQTLGHVISGQRAYGWGTAWWLANPHAADAPDLPTQIPDEFWAALPEEAEEAVGTGAEARARLDAILDLTTERLAGLPDDRLTLGARWSGFAVTLGFRLGRWSSHLREHTIQVEKTLAMLGRQPSEVERLTRLVLATYGRAEAVVFGRRLANARNAAIDGHAAIDAAESIARATAEARAAIEDAGFAAR